MYIKQWLQEEIPKRQALMVIDETIWEIKQQGKTPLRTDTQQVYKDFVSQKFDTQDESYMSVLLDIRSQTGRDIQNMYTPDGKCIWGINNMFVISLWKQLQRMVLSNES